jgi:putative ABC transport system permease protein
VVGATPELADVLPLPLATGRFLSADDVRERRNVAVLGADVADALFPGEDPLGQAIVLNRESYVVIGVLEDGGANAPAAAARHASILVPLSTCWSRFGEIVIIRTGGSRRAEAVELSDIYVTMHRSQDLADTVESIRELLRESHEKQDWAVSAADR